MERQTIGTNLTVIRERRMWTQVRLAKEAGVSPTTVSGIETGRISRPHFGTLRRLANALGVDPQALLSPERSFSAEFGKQGRPAPLSLEWARAAREKEFEEKVEHAPLKRPGRSPKSWRKSRDASKGSTANFPRAANSGGSSSNRSATCPPTPDRSPLR